MIFESGNGEIILKDENGNDIYTFPACISLRIANELVDKLYSELNINPFNNIYPEFSYNKGYNQGYHDGELHLGHKNKK